MLIYFLCSFKLLLASWTFEELFPRIFSLHCLIFEILCFHVGLGQISRTLPCSLNCLYYISLREISIDPAGWCPRHKTGVPSPRLCPTGLLDELHSWSLQRRDCCPLMTKLKIPQLVVPSMGCNVCLGSLNAPVCYISEGLQCLVVGLGLPAFSYHLKIGLQTVVTQGVLEILHFNFN